MTSEAKKEVHFEDLRAEVRKELTSQIIDEEKERRRMQKRFSLSINAQTGSLNTKTNPDARDSSVFHEHLFIQPRASQIDLNADQQELLKLNTFSLSQRRRTSTCKKLKKLQADSFFNNLSSYSGSGKIPEETKFTDNDFMAASTSGNIKVMEKFIKDGGDVNKTDDHKRTALQRAALYGEEAVIELLITKKAKMNPSDKLGATALHWACRGGHPDIIKRLVKGGAKINSKDKLFSTPLHVAVRCGQLEAVEALVSLKADVNAKDREGDTPLHDAVRLGKFKMIKILLEGGSNMNLKNTKNQTPVDMVQVWYDDNKNKQKEAKAMMLSMKECLKAGEKVQKSKAGK